MKENRPDEAFQLILEENPLPAVCGRVCHHPCEGNCRRGEVDKPVAIREIRRFIADYVSTTREALDRLQDAAQEGDLQALLALLSGAQRFRREWEDTRH